MVFGYDSEEQAENWRKSDERHTQRVAIQAIRESWELTPEQRSNAIDVVYDIVTGDTASDKMKISAFRALVAAEAQNLKLRLSADQTQRMLAAIQARLRWNQQLPEDLHPLILEQDGSQSRESESLDDVAAAVIEKINLIEASRSAGGAGEVSDANGNGKDRPDSGGSPEV